MPRMSLISSDATTAPAEKGNGYNPDRLGLVINLVISSNYNKNCVFVVAIFVWLFWRKEEDCFGRVVVKLVARYFLEVESVSKLSTHSLSSRQVHFFLIFSISSLAHYAETSRCRGWTGSWFFQRV